MKFLILSCIAAFAGASVSPVAYSTVSVAHNALLPPITPIFAAPFAQRYAVAASPVTKSQYHAQDELGQASYGHAEPLQAHNAVQDAAGNKVGSFSYVAPNGQVFATNYVADALGYRVSSNALPVAGSVALPALPADTPEVVAARVAHLNEHALVRSRARRSVVATPVTYAYHTATLSSALVNTPAHAVSSYQVY